MSYRLSPILTLTFLVIFWFGGLLATTLGQEPQTGSSQTAPGATATPEEQLARLLERFALAVADVDAETALACIDTPSRERLQALAGGLTERARRTASLAGVGATEPAPAATPPPSLADMITAYLDALRASPSLFLRDLQRSDDYAVTIHAQTEDTLAFTFQGRPDRPVYRAVREDGSWRLSLFPAPATGE